MSRCVLVILVVAQAVGACREASPPPAERKSTAPPSQPTVARAPRPEGPVGAIVGKVTLSGPAPEMPLLRRGSDPMCAAGEVRAETIVTDANGGMANTVVRVAKGAVPSWVPTEFVDLDQVDCIYRPRVQGAVTGQTLRISNSDATMHNVHAMHQPWRSREATDTITNRAQPAKQPPITIPVREQDVIRFSCDVHAWMQAFVVVSDNPYFVTTGPDGSFRLDNVPVGKHELEAWHEFYGIKTGSLTVEAGQESVWNVAYDADLDSPLAQQKKARNEGAHR